ncbi:outer membrane beta-barrel protein [Devosia sp. A16]|uniref:outer membrane beta-barrel protein n=1 Tax=Devosia sp. A16 TaxID=1736675 RepID=UPI0009E6E91C|nr:outer membrane beta-barrel protein [Devosia sp. A16]
MQTRRAGIAASAMALALLTAPAGAGEFVPLGDGSATNNADLIGYPATECAHCSTTPPDEAGNLIDIDWSLGLRGGIKDDGSGAAPTYKLIALPSVTLKQQTIRGGYDAGLSGEISYQVDGNAHIDSLTGTVGGTYDLDALTSLAGRANLKISQDDPDGPDYASNVASAPLVLSGSAEVSAARDLGAFNLAVRGSAGREVYGETVYDDSSTSDNTFQNTTSYGAGVRLGYELTPGLVAFIDTQADIVSYDAPSPSLMVKLDNVTYAGRAGLSAKFTPTLELEGSLGLGYTDFGDETLGDFSAVLYDARAVFKPDETLTLTGALTTTVSQPGTTSGATAKLTYAATGQVEYLVNPWLKLRADASWTAAHYQGIDSEEQSWGLGAGADYLLNAHTDLTADYSFLRTEKTSAPATDEHQVTLGVKFHR